MTRRLLVSYLLLTAFVLLVLEVPLGIVSARSERAQLSAAVERDAMVLAGFAEDSLERGEPADLGAAAAGYEQRTGGRVVIVDRRGHSVADSAPPAPGTRDFSTRPEIAAALRGDIAAGTRFSRTLDQGLLFVAVPVASGGRVHGAVRITYPTAAVDARVARTWWILGLVGAVVLAASGVVSVALSRSVTRPVTRLTATAARLAEGDREARAPEEEGPPEVRRLARTYNAMADRLTDLIASQQAFVADASHQLRSPLAALRLRLENLEPALDGADAAELEAAIEETVRLARLVDGLLVLARADAAPLAPAPMDAAAIVRERGAAWAALAQEQRLDLQVDVGALPAVLAVPGSLEQILDNLLANAFRVSLAGTTVRLMARQAGDHVEIHVVDRGPGLSPAQRERAFHRFWRGERTANEEGFGLGLPIVARLVAASGGEARLDAAPGGGVDALVRLPAAPAHAPRSAAPPTGVAGSVGAAGSAAGHGIPLAGTRRAERSEQDSPG